MLLGGFWAKSIFLLANYLDGGAGGQFSTLERSDYSLRLFCFRPLCLSDISICQRWPNTNDATVVTLMMLAGSTQTCLLLSAGQRRESTKRCPRNDEDRP